MSRAELLAAAAAADHADDALWAATAKAFPIGSTFPYRYRSGRTAEHKVTGYRNAGVVVAVNTSTGYSRDIDTIRALEKGDIA